jgi:hypothetical protein
VLFGAVEPCSSFPVRGDRANRKIHLVLERCDMCTAVVRCAAALTCDSEFRIRKPRRQARRLGRLRPLAGVASEHR